VEKKFPELLALIDHQWRGEEPLRVIFQDEARFGRISDIRRCWCPRPIRPVITGMVSQEYVYVYAAVSVADGALDTLILPHLNSFCMQIFLDEVSARHPDARLVMVLDGGGWHKADALQVPKNMRLIFLPPYSPELNPVEHIWDELREKSFGNLAFYSLDALEDHLAVALRTLEQDTPRVESIVAWPWIIKSLLN